MLNSDLLNKLQELKRQSDESKERLDALLITEESGNGLVRVTMNGNRVLKSVEINADHTAMEKENLEDLMCVAFNRALDQVNSMNEKEAMTSAQSLFTGL
jgi:nucleoid-associated protein EbfC